MSEPHPRIVTGLSVSIAGVVLAAVIDEEARTVRIETRGEVLNGEAEAIEAAKKLLVGRVQRTRPDLLVKD